MQTEQTYPLNIVLHGNQKVVHNHPARNKLVKAGKRFGKTKWLLYALLQKAGAKPNQVIWYITDTFTHAKEIAWWELTWLCPPQIIKRKVENELLIELTNGSRLKLLGCDNSDRLRGPKLHGVGFDEAAYIDPYVYPGIISGQLLGSNGEETGFAYFISSPNRKGRNWFTDFHAEAKRKMDAGDPDWAAFYNTIYDNPTLTPAEIESIKNLVPDDVWQVEYMAIESEFAGQIYSEFHPVENVSTQEHDPKVHQLVRGLDWGISHPTVCLWGSVDIKNKQVFVTDEYFRSGLIIQESCDWIKKMTGNRPVEWSVIDPSTSKRNSQTNRTDKDEFQRWGVPCVAGDNRDRGYDIVKMFLKRRILKIHPRCKNLLYQIKNLQWGDKEGDDCTDALRYMCVRIHDTIHGLNIMSELQQKPAILPGGKYDIRQLLNIQKSEQSNDYSWVYDEVA